MKKFFSLCISITIFTLLTGCHAANNPEESPNQHASEAKVKDSLNFLVLGIDSRGEEKSRADSILVVNYRKEDRTLKVVSIMRDSYVKIPGYQYEYDKINQAHYLGGEELLIQTIRDNFEIDIDHTVTIDFKGFVNVVDTLVPEGITVELNEKMINNMNMNKKPGENILHGEDLLKYVRFRQDTLSDFGRVNRQQDVLLEVMNKMNEKINSFVGMTKVPLLIDEALKNIESDLSVQDIITLSTTVFSQPIESIEKMRIPVKGGFENKTYKHSGAVLQINFPKNIEAVQDFFTEPEPVDDSIK